jgi:hypothetical protein
MAGFEVQTYGRFWVSTEGLPSGRPTLTASSKAGRYAARSCWLSVIERSGRATERSYDVGIDGKIAAAQSRGHSHNFDVAEGERVVAGQIVAQSGDSGVGTGPHLHFEVRDHDQPRDPQLFLPVD